MMIHDIDTTSKNTIIYHLSTYHTIKLQNRPILKIKKITTLDNSHMTQHHIIWSQISRGKCYVYLPDQMADILISG